MKNLESLNFMLGLINEEHGDPWLKMTDEGLVLHVQWPGYASMPFTQHKLIQKQLR